MDAQKFLMEFNTTTNNRQFNNLINKALKRMNNNTNNWFDEETERLFHDFNETNRAYGFSQKLKLNKSDFLVDVGCGWGDMMEKMIDSVSSIVGVDDDISFIREARRKPKLKNVKLIQSDVSKIPIEDSIFTKALCTYVFPLLKSPEHIEKTFK
jgi:ubiquinone/menaquinone biosynthesis C-methylase UbiE